MIQARQSSIFRDPNLTLKYIFKYLTEEPQQKKRITTKELFTASNYPMSMIFVTETHKKVIGRIIFLYSTFFSPAFFGREKGVSSAEIEH